MLLMARRDMSSVPRAASLTVSCSEPSWPLRNSLALCLPPLSRFNSSTNFLPISCCALPPASPTAILNRFANASPVARNSRHAVTQSAVESLCLKFIESLLWNRIMKLRVLHFHSLVQIQMFARQYAIVAANAGVFIQKTGFCKIISRPL